MALGELVSLLTGYAHARHLELRMIPVCRPDMSHGWRVQVGNADTEAATLRGACLKAAEDLGLTED